MTADSDFIPKPHSSPFFQSTSDSSPGYPAVCRPSHLDHSNTNTSAQSVSRISLNTLHISTTILQPGLFLSLVCQMSKLRHRKMSFLAQDHITRNQGATVGTQGVCFQSSVSSRTLNWTRPNLNTSSSYKPAPPESYISENSTIIFPFAQIEEF